MLNCWEGGLHDTDEFEEHQGESLFKVMAQHPCFFNVE
jgi:hypothetical protein